MTTESDHWTTTDVYYINDPFPASPMGQKEKAVNIWELSPSIRVILTPKFCYNLFDKCGTDYHVLARTLGVTYSFLMQLRRQMYSIPLPILSKLSILSSISFEEIQNHIVLVRTRAGIQMSNPFPIRSSKEMASLIGHVFGDGYVGKSKKQFEYCNNNPHLLQEVKFTIKNLFGVEPMTERWNRIGYPCIIGEILLAFGAPIAPKVNSENAIPGWIKDSIEFKRAFLRAFFDDDGSVLYTRNYPSKSVNLYVIRHTQYRESLTSLLKDIRSLLGEFGVNSGMPLLSRQYSKSDGLRDVMYLNITDYQSIENFSTSIGLTNGTKNEKLVKILMRRKNRGEHQNPKA